MERNIERDTNKKRRVKYPWVDGLLETTVAYIPVLRLGHVVPGPSVRIQP